MTASLWRRPSAYLPILMSLAAITLLTGYLMTGPHAPTLNPATGRPDEGTAAHLWQLLMGLQLPVIAFFALKYLPQAPRAALFVLVVQFLAGVAAAAPVFVLDPP